TFAEVADRQELHHLAVHVFVLLGAVADLAEERERLRGLAAVDVGLDEVTTSIATELLGVGFVARLARERRTDRLDELVETLAVLRLGRADRVEIAPRHLVE